jgi:cobalt/nickel-transporting P-type ATPase D
MTLTTLEMPAQQVSEELYQRDRSTRALSWRAALWSVISVRWAAVALALFLAGLTAQLNGAAETVWWTLYLACYFTGGWARHGPAHKRCATRPSMWTC